MTWTWTRTTGSFCGWTRGADVPAEEEETEDEREVNDVERASSGPSPGPGPGPAPGERRADAGGASGDGGDMKRLFVSSEYGIYRRVSWTREGEQRRRRVPPTTRAVFESLARAFAARRRLRLRHSLKFRFGSVRRRARRLAGLPHHLLVLVAREDMGRSRSPANVRRVARAARDFPRLPSTRRSKSARRTPPRAPTRPRARVAPHLRRHRLRLCRRARGASAADVFVDVFADDRAGTRSPGPSSGLPRPRLRRCTLPSRRCTLPIFRDKLLGPLSRSPSRPPSPSCRSSSPSSRFVAAATRRDSARFSRWEISRGDPPPIPVAVRSRVTRSASASNIAVENERASSSSWSCSWSWSSASSARSWSSASSARRDVAIPPRFSPRFSGNRFASAASAAATAAMAAPPRRLPRQPPPPPFVGVRSSSPSLSDRYSASIIITSSMSRFPAATSVSLGGGSSRRCAGT